MEISLEEVFQAYFECRRNKRRTCNALKFEVNYEIECVRLWKEINNKEYKISRSICFIVTRPKKREIFAANFRDRIVHHIIMHRLEPLFEEEFIQDNYNCRKNKGTLYGIKRLHEQVKICSDNYTKDCYIGKFDFQGFFMSICKSKLYEKLECFINNKYYNEDKDLLSYLVNMVVMNNPELNCIRRSPSYMWNGLPKNKSLFTSDKDHGMPIGNLTSQMFANFYMNQLDKEMVEMFTYYGRYVDDFFIISEDKNKILNAIPYIKTKLYDNLNITLHPDKIYIQHYKKGVLFTGAVIKGKLMYTSNRTVSNFIKSIYHFNKLSEQIEGYVERYTNKFLSSINSYCGFLSHYNTYAIRRKLFNRINCNWKKVCDIYGDFVRFSCKKKYDKVQLIKNKIKTFNYFKLW